MHNELDLTGNLITMISLNNILFWEKNTHSFAIFLITLSTDCSTVCGDISRVDPENFLRVGSSFRPGRV